MSWIGAPAEAAGRRYSQRELCTLANLVVVGTVTNRNPQWTEGGTVILTTVTLSVDRVVTGTPRSTVQVNTLGGQIGTVVQHVGEEPAMEVGHRYLLLLHEPSSGAAPLLIGGTFGARRLDPEEELRTEEEMRQEWAEACDEYL